jgi:hypothetical protein
MEVKNDCSQVLKEDAMLETREITGGIRCGMCGVINWPTAMCCMGCNAALDKTPLRAIAHNRTAPDNTGDLSFSQSLARFFEIIDFILLVPSSYGLLMSLMFLGAAPFLMLAIWGWFAAGCLLMRGFFRHSRGRLERAQVSRLWWLTIGYNMVDLALLWMMAASNMSMGLFYLGLWPLLVVVFSAMALASESRRSGNFSYE